MTQRSITFYVYHTILDTGKQEVKIFTSQQWAGYKRTKEYKKKLLNKEKLAEISLELKTK